MDCHDYHGITIILITLLDGWYLLFYYAALAGVELAGEAERRARTTTREMDTSSSHAPNPPDPGSNHCKREFISHFTYMRLLLSCICRAVVRRRLKSTQLLAALANPNAAFLQCDEAIPHCRNCQKSKRHCMGYNSDRTNLQSTNPTILLPAPIRHLATSPVYSHQGQISAHSDDLASRLPVPIVPSSRIDDSARYPG
jgi:hypothetical protein